ncbi:MAG: hypothetical protein IPK72_08070 [Candidatus Eisenbacteria bacterium]|nr:hypothetical protein [Candidatus Eisenbacteria bacterium]
MKRSNLRRASAGPLTPLRTAALGAVLFTLSGCATKTIIHPQQLEAGRTLANAKVETLDNLEYRFERVTVGADSLVGEYRVQVERQSRDEEIYYDEVTRTYTLPLDSVLRITQSKRDPSKTLMAGAGLFAVGFVIHDLSGDDGVARSGGGGSVVKPDPR